ncbi:hypothetical protein FZ983_16805 [Azospirillum sp. B21]|uniref:hypothetical protein n=1 Tax=Azospirillum sp. B21 TaxID=2607496 RepID=UPI0011EE4848|nr:hypothetical protein [Azospirillum sp. B21]KAA0578986.1 hypothetical protein FZ983_16805 [Azospirillum sp. B21]
MMMLIKPLIGALFALYAIASFFFGVSDWSKQREYHEACQRQISLRAKPDEQTWAMIGFYARGEKGLFDITLDAISWPGKIFLLSTEPNLVVEANHAFAEIEKTSGAASLEQKYCSDIKRS